MSGQLLKSPYLLISLAIISGVRSDTRAILNDKMTFTGSNYHELSAAYSTATSFDADTDYTIALWFRTKESAGTLVSKTTTGASWATRGKSFFVRHSVLGIDSHGIGYIQASTSVTDNRWHHAAFVFEKSSNKYSLYLDGDVDKTGTLAIQSDDNSHRIRVGQTNDNFIGKFTGNIRDVLYYDKALDTNSIMRLRSSSWDSRTSFGVLLETEFPLAETFTYDLDFLTFTGRIDYSLSLWIKTTDSAGSLIRRTDSAGQWQDKGKQFFISSGKLKFDAYNVGNVETDTAVNDGQWHFVVFTQDIEASQDGWKLYVDGELAKSAQKTPSEDNSNHVIKIGENYIGFMKEVDYFRYTMSAEEVKWRYNGFKDGTVCDSDWHGFGGNCYWFSYDLDYAMLNQSDAEIECRAKGGELASFANQAEFDFARYHYTANETLHYGYFNVSGFTKALSLWVGLKAYEPQTNNYRYYTDGSPAYWQPWKATHPKTTESECSYILYTINWDSYWHLAEAECDKNTNYICKKSEPCHFNKMYGQRIGTDHANQYTTLNGVTLEDCKRSCITEATFDCRSLNYKESTQQCDLLDIDLYNLNAASMYVRDADFDLYIKQCSTDKTNVCIPGWHEWRGQCYKFSGSPQTFSNAEAQCTTDQGILASIGSPEEMEFLKGISRSHYPYYSFYIGMKWSHNEFRWIDSSSVFYTNFGHGEGNQRVIACEGKVAKINCGLGNKIRISYANFGRTSNIHCPSNILRSDCVDTTAITIVADSCNGNQLCEVNATTGTFSPSDDCGGASRYLEVQYSCVPDALYGPPSCVAMYKEDNYTWHDTACDQTDLHYICKQPREYSAPLDCIWQTEEGSNTATCPASHPNAMACKCSCANRVIRDQMGVCDCSLCGSQTKSMARCCKNTAPPGYDPGPDYQAFVHCDSKKKNGDIIDGVACPREYPTGISCACGHCENEWDLVGNNTCYCKPSVTTDWQEIQCCKVTFKPRARGEVKDRFLRVQGAGISGHNDWTEASPTGDEQGCLEACEAKLGCRSFDFQSGTCYMSKDTRHTVSAASFLQQLSNEVYFEKYDVDKHPIVIKNYFREYRGQELTGLNDWIFSSVTELTCLQLCLDRTDCRSAEYDQISSDCYLSRSALKDNKDKFDFWRTGILFERLYTGEPYLDSVNVMQETRTPTCGLIGAYMDQFHRIEYAALSGYNAAHHSGVTLENCLNNCVQDTNCVSIDQRDIDSGVSNYVCDLSHNTRLNVNDPSHFMEAVYPSYNNYEFVGYRGNYLRDSFMYFPNLYLKDCYIGSQLTKTLTECMELCVDDNRCKSFDYHTGQSYCQICTENRFTAPPYMLADDLNVWDHYEFIGTRASVSSCQCTNECNSLNFFNDQGMCNCHGGSRATATCIRAKHLRRPPCPPGTYSASGFNEENGCQECPAGTFTGDSGSVYCKPCPPGHVAVHSGQTSCLICPTSSAASSNHTRCRSCDKDYKQDSEGAGFCEAVDCLTSGQGRCADKFVRCETGDAASTSGTKFYLMFLESDSDQSDGMIFLSTEELNMVTVTITSDGWGISETIQLTNSERVNFTVSNALKMKNSSLSAKAIVVSAAANIQVVARNMGVSSGDDFTVIPQSSLGYEYFALCWEPSAENNTQIGILATENTTVVVVTLNATVTYDGVTYLANQRIHLTMNEGDTVQLQSVEDLSGTRVSSDKPVAVFSGNTKAEITPGRSGVLQYQMIPVRSWGISIFKPTTLSGRTNYVRVVTSEDHTTITLRGQHKTKIIKCGDVVTFKSDAEDSTMYISADKPVLAVAFIDGGYGSAPSMLLLPPVEQGLYSYEFVSEHGSLVMIAIRPCFIDGLRLDDEPLSAERMFWEALPSETHTDVMAATIPVTSGFHVISHTGVKDFNLVVYEEVSNRIRIYSPKMRMRVLNSELMSRTFIQPPNYGKGYKLVADKLKYQKHAPNRLMCLRECMGDAVCHGVLYQKSTEKCHISVFHHDDLDENDFSVESGFEFYTVRD